MGLAKHRRLRRRAEFRRILRDGTRARDAILSITAADSDNPDGDSRYGFAIPKRVGNAVTRNRIKRRLRSIFQKSDHPRGWDYVIYAFPLAADATSEKLAESANKLVNRTTSRHRSRNAGERTRRSR